MEHRFDHQIGSLSYHIDGHLLFLRADGVLTNSALAEMMRDLAASRIVFYAAFVDYRKAIIAYSGSEEWNGYRATKPCGVLLREDQIEQFSLIAEQRARSGFRRRSFTDESQCLAWTRRQALRALERELAERKLP